MPKNFSVGLCLMVWNEIEGCKFDVPRLPADCFEQVFALDGGSTDGTVAYLENAGIPVVPQRQRGYDRAYIEAFEHTTCDALIIFHPKGSVEPESLKTLIPLLRDGVDLVVASRNAKGARNEEDVHFLKPRKWFVIVLSAISAMLWWRGKGPIVWDVLHGYRAMTRQAFFAMQPIAEGMSMDLQMVVRSYRLGFSRAEVPVLENPRLDGATHFKAIPTGLMLLRYLWLELKRKKPSEPI